jgi:hypothetical protein
VPCIYSTPNARDLDGVRASGDHVQIVCIVTLVCKPQFANQAGNYMRGVEDEPMVLAMTAGSPPEPWFNTSIFSGWSWAIVYLEIPSCVLNSAYSCGGLDSNCLCFTGRGRHGGVAPPASRLGHDGK